MKYTAKLKLSFINALFYCISLLPFRVLFFFSEIITFTVYRVMGYRRKVVFDNISRSFPDKNLKQIKFIQRKYYRHLSVMVIENIKLRYISKNKFSNSIIIENKALFDDLYKQGRNIIIMMGHFGNWEYGSGLTRFIPFKGSAVYKQLSDDAFDRLYYEIRHRLGVQPIEMKAVFKEVIRLNKQKEPTALFMISDQSPGKGEPQYITKFLNQKTGFYQGAEKIAIRFNMPVVYIELLRHNKGSYRVIPKLITDMPTKTRENEITQKYVELLESSITQSPRYWLWSHKRWKHQFD